MSEAHGSVSGFYGSGEDDIDWGGQYLDLERIFGTELFILLCRSCLLHNAWFDLVTRPNYDT